MFHGGQIPYPLKLAYTCIRKFVHNKVNPKKRLPSIPTLRQYITLPYYGEQSYETTKRLNELLTLSLSHIDFRIIFTNKFEI